MAECQSQELVWKYIILYKFTNKDSNACTFSRTNVLCKFKVSQLRCCIVSLFLLKYCLIIGCTKTSYNLHVSSSGKISLPHVIYKRVIILLRDKIIFLSASPIE